MEENITSLGLQQNLGFRFWLHAGAIKKGKHLTVKQKPFYKHLDLLDWLTWLKNLARLFRSQLRLAVVISKFLKPTASEYVGPTARKYGFPVELRYV